MLSANLIQIIPGGMPLLCQQRIVITEPLDPLAFGCLLGFLAQTRDDVGNALGRADGRAVSVHPVQCIHTRFRKVTVRINEPREHCNEAGSSVSMTTSQLILTDCVSLVLLGITT